MIFLLLCFALKNILVFWQSAIQASYAVLRQLLFFWSGKFIYFFSVPEIMTDRGVKRKSDSPLEDAGGVKRRHGDAKQQGSSETIPCGMYRTNT